MILMSRTMLLTLETHKELTVVLAHTPNPHQKATYDNHCLHHLLPFAKSNKYGLRDIGHGLLIDHATSE